MKPTLAHRLALRRAVESALLGVTPTKADALLLCHSSRRQILFAAKWVQQYRLSVTNTPSYGVKHLLWLYN